MKSKWKWIALITAPLAGLLSAMAGGDYPKQLRRFAIPGIVMLESMIFMRSFWGVFVFLLALPYSLGHGVPDPIGVRNRDEGSSLGRFWYSITHSRKETDMLIRGTKAILKILVFLIIPIITGKWLVWGLCGIGIIATNVLFGGNAIIKGEGTFNFFGHELNWEEFIIAFFDILFLNIILLT